MKKISLNILLSILFGILMVLLLFIAIFQPSFNDLFDFTIQNKVNITAVLNNIFTPIITLVSVILLYITLNKQIESIADQRKSKNLDLILTMINNLENEYNLLKNVIKGTRGTMQERVRYEDHFTGYDAIVSTLTNLRNHPQEFWKDFFTDKIMSLISNYKSTSNTLEGIIVDENLKVTLKLKLDNFYEKKMRNPFLLIAFNIQKNGDKTSIEFLDFVKEKELKSNKNFDLSLFNTEESLMETINN